jgi:bifunctional DNA-binding transcriptional regulator/antitoxin component of YhaV-PrlF toxin-antitoxin module
MKIALVAAFRSFSGDSMSRVTERGQITIDRRARRELGVQPGMIAYQRVANGRLEVVFLPAPHHRSLFGAFHREGEPPKVLTGDDLEAAVIDAVAGKHRPPRAEHA